MSEQAAGGPLTLAEILETFEARTAPFDVHEVADAVRGLARQYEASGTAVTNDIRAEWLGFTLMENYRGDEGFTWGTYYGPVGVFHDEKGIRVEMPPIAEITPDVIAYWRERARTARHPLLRIRYADLVWEFGRHAKLAPGPEFPRAVIDATVAAAGNKLFEHSTVGFTSLRRALSVALSLRDDVRVVAVRDALVAYEDAVSEDALPGTWGIAFDELLATKSKAVPMSPELVLKVVSDLEARLGRLAYPKELGALPDGFAVEAAALRLARHYRAAGDQAGVRRVVLDYGEAFRTAAAKASPMLAMAWLERVLDTYRTFGLTKEAEATEVRLRELGPEAMMEMKPVSTAIEIPAEEVERFLDALTTGSLQEVLVRIAVQFIPDKAAVTREVHWLAKSSPLSAIFSQKLIDHEGRPIAEIGSVEDDLDGRVVRQTSQHMQLEIPWLRAVIDRMRERLKPTAADLRAHLLTSRVFDEGKTPILERGLAAYLDGEAIVAVPMLIPQVEDALRNLVRVAGGSTYKPHRLGGLMLKALDDLLREEIVVKSLGENVVHYFRVLLTDQRGWNIRNDVCHGIAPVVTFAAPVTDRLFHALLVLALLHEPEGRAEDKGEHGTA
ncbi:MAG TPA: DUF4209 domain-containing protein [Candidatus Acidoferrum sp.]|nr:DUF4209 domain-containing protein [Candidatus Acidoferrum sp.]